MPIAAVFTGRYALAIVAPLVALALRAALAPLLGDVAPMLIFLLAVVLAAWRGGLGPGLVATVLSAALAAWFLIEPLYSFGIDSAPEATRLAVFAVEGVAISLLGQASLPSLNSPYLRSLPRMVVLRLTLLIAVLFAVLLGVLLSAGQAYWREVLRGEIDARLSAVADSRLRMVQAQIALHRQRAELKADDRDLRNVLAGAATVQGSGRVEGPGLLNQMADGNPIRAARLLDAHGRVVLATDASEVGRNFAGEPVFQQGLVGPQFGLPRRVGNGFEAVLSAPVLGAGEPPRTLGVLMLTADVTPLAMALRDPAGLGQTGETLLGVREGGRVRFLFPPRHGGELVTAVPDEVPPMAAATEGRNFLQRSHDYRGQAVLAAARPVGYGGWGLVAKMDEAEAYAPIAHALRYGLGLGAVIALVGLAAAYGLARHGLTLAEGRDTARVGLTLDFVMRGCAVSALLIGLVVLAGWALDITALKSVLPGLAVMKPNTAMGFVLAGLALALRQHGGPRLVCAAALLALGGLSLAQDVTGADFGTDNLLFREAVSAAQMPRRGRMSGITAANFVLIGGALALLGTRWPASRRTSEALALLTGSTALVALVGYAYGIKALYQLPGFGSVALHTALAFALLAIGVLCARTDGLAGVFAGTGLGGQIARRFMPLAMGMPLVLGWLALKANEAGLIDPTLEAAVFAVAMVLALTALSWRNALMLEGSDVQRQHAEAQQRSVLEAAPNGLLMVDGRGHILLVNGAMERLFGYTRQEMLGQQVEMFLPERVRGPHRDLRSGFMAHPHDRAMGAGRDLFGRRKDGSEFPIEIGLSAIQTPEGPSVLASVVDITERKHAEEKLRTSEARFRGTFENAAVGIAHISPGGRFLSVNEHLCQMVGYTRDELLARTVHDITHPDDVESSRARAAEIVAGQSASYLVDKRYIHKDGSCIWVSLAVSLQRGLDGQPDYIVSVIRDISDRKRDEQELAQGRQRFAGIVESAMDAIITIGADERIVLFNAAAQSMFRCTAQQALGATVDQFLPARFRAAYHRHVRRFGGSGVTSLAVGDLGELLFGLRTDGEEFPIEASISKLEIGGERFFTVILRDITARKQAEKALREGAAAERARRAEMETLMAAIPAAVFIAHDAACEQITGNPAAMDLLRVPSGQNPSAIAPGADRPAYQVWSQGRRLAPQELPMQRAAATGEAVSGTEVDILFPDGEMRNLLGGALPLFDDAGAVRGCVGAFMDITERKRRERNLTFLTELQKLFAPISSDVDLMRVASERIARHLSLKRCMLVEIDEAGQQAIVLHDHHAADVPGLVGVHPLTEFRNELERQELAAGKTLVTHDVRADSRDASEARRMEARGIRSMVSAPYVADGRWKFLLSAQLGEPHAWPREDVDLLTELAARLCVRIERARAVQRLVESEESMRLAAEAARFGMYDRDLHGGYFHVSGQLKQMLGYAPDARIEHAQVMSHIHPDDRQLGVEAFQRACEHAAEGRIEIEQRIVRRDGVVRWIATVGQLLFKDGAPARSLGFWVDITERKEAEVVLRRRNEELRTAAEVALASKYKSEFLANMSHELRTPLNSLLILSRLLADNRDGNLSTKQVEYAATIHQSGSDLLDLINEILDLSKIEAGQMAVGIEAVALADVGQRVERDFRHVAQAKHLDFDIHVDPDLTSAVIRSDGRRLQQVLKNLLSNAFKFTEKGNVRLEIGPATDGWSRPHPMLDQASGVIAFAVSDSGIGIAPEKQQLIFEAFAQADGTTTRKYGGTGLGLSISREIASLLGGAIVLKSRPGEGSTFTLYLPQSYTPKAGTADRKGSHPVKSRHVVEPRAHPVDDRQLLVPGDELLLMVENDPSFAKLLLEIAHRHGFKVLLAASVTAALHLARQYRPTAITLSVTLPDMDGWQLLDRVREDLDLRHIPVHIISGEDERPRGLRRGAVSCLQKPATEDALGALFERIRATQAREHALLLVVEDNLATQRQIVDAIGTSADLEATVVASAEAALAQLKARRYDCVVLDLRLPAMSGLEFLEAVRDQLHIDDLPIVVYTGMDLSAQQQTRLNRLAESVLLKDARSIDQLLDETAYYLHRPIAALPGAAREAIARLHASAPVLAGKKVLVVDDDMRNVFAVLAILEAEGVEVSHAENGRQCLDMLEQTPDFDAVLMDIMMPVMDGYEAMRRLRQMEGLKTLPVIALTAKVMQGDRDKCMAAGASDYLAKPVDAGQLVALLRQWTRGARQNPPPH